MIDTRESTMAHSLADAKQGPAGAVATVSVRRQAQRAGDNGSLGVVLTEFQRVAYALELSAARERLRIIGFTSAVPGEGVSTCIAAISFLLASAVHTRPGRGQTGSPPGGSQRQAEDKVVLVDANAGSPSLHEAFGLPLQPGLTEAVNSAQPLSVARPMENPALLVVPAGRGAHTALDMQRLRLALQQFASQAGLVLVDLPPVLRAAHGVKLATLCDAVVMVVRANSTRWEAVVEAKRLLERAGVPILGAILNRRRFELPKWLYEHL